MTTNVTNTIKAAALIALGLAIAVMGIYVANADDAPGAAVIGFVLMLAAVLCGLWTARNRLPIWAGRAALAGAVFVAAFSAFLTHAVTVAAPLFAQPPDVPSVIDSAPPPQYAAAVERARELVRAAILEQYAQCQQHPWKSGEVPLVAAWLAQNKSALDRMIAASRRTHFYSPLTAPESNELLMNCLLPELMVLREVARAFTVRAMLQIGEGAGETAETDLLACHRLARHAGQSPLMIHGLNAIAIDGMAQAGDQALAASGSTPLAAE